MYTYKHIPFRATCSAQFLSSIRSHFWVQHYHLQPLWNTPFCMFQFRINFWSWIDSGDLIGFLGLLSPTTDNSNTESTRAYIHAPKGMTTHDPSVSAIEDHKRLGSHSHCNRLCYSLVIQIINFFVMKIYPASNYFLSHSSKYFPRLFLCKHPQFMVFL